MKVLRCLLLLPVFLPLWVGCNPSNDASTTGKGINAPAFDTAEILQDIKTGKLKFEIRGLTNEAQEKSYGGKGFQHSAMIIPVGESKYVKGAFLLVCSVKRISGGDPENARKADDITTVYVHDGMGRLTEGGGYRTKDEKWEPERIEVRPEVVFIGTPIAGPAVQE